jgi:hypothetical protein
LIPGTKINLRRNVRSRAWLDNPRSLGYTDRVASLRVGNVLFIAYPQDHQPRHVHGFTGETEVIVDLRIDGNVALADRPDCIRPGNAKRSDVRRILTAAVGHFDELVLMWERMHA